MTDLFQELLDILSEQCDLLFVRFALFLDFSDVIGDRVVLDDKDAGRFGGGRC